MSNTTNSASNRIKMLLDENSFVEIGAMVKARATDFNMLDKDTPADGVITGYGVIDGSLVYVYSQDASVLNGTIGEMHAKKIAKIYELAMKMGAPVIGLLDCAGLRLQEATDALNAFGEIYKLQALASGVIPQISAVFGTCGGGLALFPGLTDFTFMEEKNGKLFVNSPNALDGNYESKLNSASAKFQSEESGLVDFAGSEAEVFAQIRQLVSMLPANNEDDMSYDVCEDDLNRLCDNIVAEAKDAAIMLADISDNNVFFQTKAAYAKSMVTGFIKLNGTTVGVVANRTEMYDEEGNVAEKFDSVLTPRACEKAAEFINFCDAFNIPVVSFTNVTGFEATVCSEKRIAKAAAKLTYAFANATVPKVNVIVGEAFGSAYVTMNSKATGADMVFAWPQASIGMMDATQAAKIMYSEELKASEDFNKELSAKVASYKELQASVNSAAQRGYVDSIIEPVETRKYLIATLEMLFTKRESRPSKKHGTI